MLLATIVKIISDNLIIYLLILCGIINASQLYWQHQRYQKHHQQMVCPINGRGCQAVADSEYTKIFGVQNEIWGIFYLLALAILILANGILISYLAELTKLAILLLASLGLLYSLYLTYLQAFVIKKYCFWCLVSAIDTVALFIIIYINYL